MQRLNVHYVDFQANVQAACHAFIANIGEGVWNLNAMALMEEQMFCELRKQFPDGDRYIRECLYCILRDKPMPAFKYEPLKGFWGPANAATRDQVLKIMLLKGTDVQFMKALVELGVIPAEMKLDPEVVKQVREVIETLGGETMHV